MFKKLFNTIINLIIIAGLIYIVYYFYTSSQNNSLLEDGTLSLYSNTNEINSSLEDSSDNSIGIRFYYTQLDDYAKLIYTALENNIDNLKKDNYKIDFSTKFNSLLNQSNGNAILNRSFQSSLDAFFYDHPELFYIDLTKISMLTKSSSFINKTTYYVSLVPQNGKNYLADGFSSEAQVDIAIKQVEDLRNKIISNVSGNNYNKALIVHDTLADLITYDKSTARKNTHNIYGALVEKKVVCEGYAKSFKYIMDSLGIPCILVGGSATNSSGKTESHMWNYIQLNGNWYGVDVTWDDPIIIGAYVKNNICHDYFAKGYHSFTSHKPDEKLSDTGMIFTYPTLSEKNYK